MSSRPSTTRMVRTIRLNDERIARIIARLDINADRKQHERRKSGRYPYRIKGLVVHMRQPGAGSPVPYLVPTRDISTRGLSFLHGGFVHTGTDCVVQLISTEGAWKTVTASVVRCRFLEGNVHEVGIRFNEAIRPSEFAATALPRRVLVAEPDPLMFKLAAFHLQQLETQVLAAADTRSALKAAIDDSLDALVLSAQLPEAEVLELIRDVRAADLPALIAAAVPPAGATATHLFYSAGCDLLVARPYRREDLVRIAETLVRDDLLKDCPTGPANRNRLLKLLDAVPTHYEQIADAVGRKDGTGVLELAARLRVAAEREGCRPVARLCSQLERITLVRGAREGRSALDEILTLAMQLRYAVRRIHQPQPVQIGARGESVWG